MAADPCQATSHRPLRGRTILATHNPGKLIEIRDLMAPYGVAVVSAAELQLPEPEEVGAAFGENARLKAQACARSTVRGDGILLDRARPA